MFWYFNLGRSSRRTRCKVELPRLGNLHCASTKWHVWIVDRLVGTCDYDVNSENAEQRGEINFSTWYCVEERVWRMMVLVPTHELHRVSDWVRSQSTVPYVTPDHGTVRCANSSRMLCTNCTHPEPVFNSQICSQNCISHFSSSWSVSTCHRADLSSPVCWISIWLHPKSGSYVSFDSVKTMHIQTHMRLDSRLRCV